MVNDVHGGEPETIGVQLLHRFQARGLLLPLLQGGPAVEGAGLDGEGDTGGVRATEGAIYRHVGPLQRIQATMAEYECRQG